EFSVLLAGSLISKRATGAQGCPRGYFPCDAISCCPVGTTCWPGSLCKEPCPNGYKTCPDGSCCPVGSYCYPGRRCAVLTKTTSPEKPTPSANPKPTPSANPNPIDWNIKKWFYDKNGNDIPMRNGQKDYQINPRTKDHIDGFGWDHIVGDD